MKCEDIKPRRKTLVVCCAYPAFSGSGSQIRAAALVHMLAAREDVFLAVIGGAGSGINSCAQEMASICSKILFINPVPDCNQPGLSVQYPVDEKHLRVSCTRANIGNVVRDFYNQNALELLFLFRIEAYLSLHGELGYYTHKYMDLDELYSGNHSVISDLKIKNGLLFQVDARRHVMLKSVEKSIIALFDKVFVSSELEAAEINGHTACDNVHVLPNTYPRRAYQARRPAVSPLEILFVGSFFYYPNEDAVLYFCRDIFPLLRQPLGDSVVFRVIGFSMPESFQGIENQPGVCLMGYQKDLHDYYSRAALAVVPLRAGTGTRMKILESMAYGCPVVSTSIGARGLKVTHGKNILIADEPEAFANSCMSLLESPGLAASISEKGLLLQRKHYSPEVLLRHYDGLRD